MEAMATVSLSSVTAGSVVEATTLTPVAFCVPLL